MQQSQSSQAAISRHYAALVQALCAISEIYYLQGRLDEALGLLRANEQYIKDEAETREQVEFLLHYGRVLIRHFFLTNQGRDLLLTTAQQGGQLAETTHDEGLIADTLALFGQVYYYVGLNESLYSGGSLQGDNENYAQTLIYMQRALEHGEASGNTRVVSEAHFYTGLVHERRSQADPAQQSYMRAWQVARQHGHKLEQSYAARHLSGVILEIGGSLEQALAYALESLSLREEVGFESALPHSHLLVSEVYVMQNDLANALFHAQQAQELAERQKQADSLIFSALAIGDIHLAQHETEQARANFERAYALAQKQQLAYAISQAKERLERLGKA